MNKTQQELVSLQDGPKQSGLSAYINDNISRFSASEIATAISVFKLTEQNVERNRGAALKLSSVAHDHNWEHNVFIRFAKLEDLLDDGLEDS